MTVVDPSSKPANRTPRKIKTLARDLDHLKSLLALAALRSEIVNKFEVNSELIESARASLPPSEEILLEASRLQIAFNGRIHKLISTSLGNLTEAAFEAMLHNNIRAENNNLEGGDDNDIYFRFKKDIDMELDVQGKLEHAWAFDQAVILTARGECLDNVRLS